MERSRWLALTVLCAAMMMIILDGTIVTVALSAIQRDLGFSSSGLAWVVNAYLIAFGGLLLAGERGTGPRALRGGADAAGAVLVTGGLMAAVYAIVQTTGYGWGSARTLGAASVAVVMLAAFAVRQHLARTPLLPLRIFRSRD